jgi:hypothetical protein
MEVTWEAAALQTLALLSTIGIEISTVSTLRSDFLYHSMEKEKKLFILILIIYFFFI